MRNMVCCQNKVSREPIINERIEHVRKMYNKLK